MTPSEYQELYQQEQKINIRKYIYLFISHWYWFVLALIVALTAAYLKNRYTQPMYSGSATIVLEDQGNQAGVWCAVLLSFGRSRLPGQLVPLCDRLPRRRRTLHCRGL